jgi:P-type conjugative transfer protein TrbL
MFSTTTMEKRRYYIYSLFFLCFLFIFPDVVFAAGTKACSQQLAKNISPSGFAGLSVDPGDFINNMLCEYYLPLSSILAERFQANAKAILKTLFVIDATWMGICWLIASSDFGEMIPALAKKFIFYFFMWGLIDNAYQAAQSGNLMDNKNWVATIPNGFAAVGTMLAENSTTPNRNSSIGDPTLMRVNPGQIFDDGLVISLSFFGRLLAMLFSPGSLLPWNFLACVFIFLFGAFVAIAISIMFSLLAMDLFVNFVEAYITTAVGIFIFGVASSRWTVGFVNVYLAYVLGLGIRIMMGITVYALSYDILKQTIDATPFTPSLTAPKEMWRYMADVLAEVFVLFQVVKQVPQIAGGFMTNTSMMTAGSGIQATASAAKSTIGAGSKGAQVLGAGVQSGGKLLGGDHREAGAGGTGLLKPGFQTRPPAPGEQTSQHIAGADASKWGERTAGLNKSFSKLGNRVKLALGAAKEGYQNQSGGVMKSVGSAIKGSMTGLGETLKGKRGRGDDNAIQSVGKAAANLSGKVMNNAGKGMSGLGRMLDPQKSRIGKIMDKSLGKVEGSGFLSSDRAQIMALSTISIEFPAED